MNSTHKKLTLLTLLSVVSCGAVVFASIVNLSSVSFASIKASGSTSYEVTFQRAQAYSDSSTTYTYKNSTQSGNDIYLVSTGGNSRASGAIASIPTVGSTSVESPVLKFYLDSSASNPFRYQSLSSISVTTSGNVVLSIQTSIDGFTYSEKGTFSCGTTAGTFSTFDESDRFVAITVSERSTFQRNITKVVVGYDCDNSDRPYFSSGEFSGSVIGDKTKADSPMSLVFNSDGYGYYKFFYSTGSAYQYTLFSWSFNPITSYIHVDRLADDAATGTSLDGMSNVGSTTTYDGYRLFHAFNANGKNDLSLYGSSLFVYFYTTNSSTARRAAPVVLTFNS